MLVTPWRLIDFVPQLLLKTGINQESRKLQERFGTYKFELPQLSAQEDH